MIEPGMIEPEMLEPRMLELGMTRKSNPTGKARKASIPAAFQGNEAG
jgi:hypothetical protein